MEIGGFLIPDFKYIHFPCCVHRGSAFNFSPIKVSLTILRNYTLLDQKTAYMQMRLHSAFHFYHSQILQSAFPMPIR